MPCRLDDVVAAAASRQRWLAHQAQACAGQSSRGRSSDKRGVAIVKEHTSRLEETVRGGSGDR
jgi:hypothetical protein